MPENFSKKIGSYSLTVGLIIAVVLGLELQEIGSASSWLLSLLIILGILTGLLNISATETKEFLFAAGSLIIISFAASTQINSWSSIILIGPYLRGIFDNILMFIITASVAVALKNSLKYLYREL